MNTNQETTKLGLVQLTLHPDAGVDHLNEAAALIRDIPRVDRVRVDPYTFRLEILYRYPTQGLLQEIHQALVTAGAQLTELRPR